MTCQSSWPRVTLSVSEVVCPFSLGTVWAEPQAHLCGSRGPPRRQVPEPVLRTPMGCCQGALPHLHGNGQLLDLWIPHVERHELPLGCLRVPQVCAERQPSSREEDVTPAFREGAVQT